MPSIKNLDLQRRAFLYANAAGIAIDGPVEPFNGGDDGSVWFTTNISVVKTFYDERNYIHELTCYQRLKSAGIGRKIREFNVPQLMGSNDGLLAIEITTVFPPYILDFGKAYLVDPEFPEHVMEEWHERMRKWWHDDLKEIRTVLAVLRRCGIWYYDAKPGNVMVKDWNPEIDADEEW